jgi:hypothetical protein
VIEGVYLFYGAAGGNVALGFAAPMVLAVGAANITTDNRQSLPVATTWGAQSIAAPSVPDGIVVNVPAAGSILLDRSNCAAFPFIQSNQAAQNLVPGQFAVVGGSANQTLDVTVWGYDREATESEF